MARYSRSIADQHQWKGQRVTQPDPRDDKPAKTTVFEHDFQPIKDLQSWKQKIDKISSKAPGSEAAVNTVRNRVKRLLNIQPPVKYKVQPEPLPGIFGRSS